MTSQFNRCSLCVSFLIFFSWSSLWRADGVLSTWGKIMIPLYRLWLHGLYGLHRHRCPLSPKRPLNLITHSLFITSIFLTIAGDTNPNFAYFVCLLYLCKWRWIYFSFVSSHILCYSRACTSWTFLFSNTFMMQVPQGHETFSSKLMMSE